MHLVHYISADALQTLLGWASVISCLGAYAILLRINDRRQDKPLVRAFAQPPERRASERDRRDLTSIAEGRSSGADSIEALQARATTQVDAAEHAFNRLLADCAGIMALTVKPTLQPMRGLALASEPVPARVQSAPRPIPSRYPARPRVAVARAPATAAPPPAL